MAGGESDWNTLLAYQKQAADEAKSANKYSKWAAISAGVGLLIGAVALGFQIFS